ncbi:hypothetical protein HDU79_010033 [Rhizoclosmatium sp. JEL0117]|nr:hypothetical protein HDU79_010033 [Rhizoclosmatium sp. JEL0117]
MFTSLNIVPKKDLNDLRKVALTTSRESRLKKERELASLTQIEVEIDFEAMQKEIDDATDLQNSMDVDNDDEEVVVQQNAANLSEMHGSKAAVKVKRSREKFDAESEDLEAERAILAPDFKKQKTQDNRTDPVINVPKASSQVHYPRIRLKIELVTRPPATNHDGSSTPPISFLKFKLCLPSAPVSTSPPRFPRIKLRLPPQPSTQENTA